MHAHEGDGNDMSALERRLAAWRPDDGGLDAEAMLFAAGVAAGRRRERTPWMAATGTLAFLVFALGVRGVSEKGERAMAISHQQSTQEEVVAPTPIPASTPAPANGLFALQKSIEQDPDRWLAMNDQSSSSRDAAPPNDGSILRADPRRTLPPQ